MAASTPPLKIFYAYANEDQQWQERLERQLITLQQQGLIVRWHEGNISAGATRQQAIQTSLETADLVWSARRSPFSPPIQNRAC